VIKFRVIAPKVKKRNKPEERRVAIFAPAGWVNSKASRGFANIHEEIAINHRASKSRSG